MTLTSDIALTTSQSAHRVKIPNHFSSPLSSLDLAMVRSVPPGGNWKNIPVSVPSKRLEQIRTGYSAGQGSRSTYYGRLRPDAPAYTISTYFNRPGNGCYIHYDYDRPQHRLISQREAARLQSFPDSFAFAGNRASVNKQIGNAVPPLLSYQIAQQLGPPGSFIDVFAGAGGLSTGFIWAGWTPIIANDLDDTFLRTYAVNVHDAVLSGDLRDRKCRARIVDRVRQRAGSSKQRFFVLGGPPCQGFSTAGNRRSLEDERNQLFLAYRSLLVSLSPDGFLFENVPGILNMMEGKAFRIIRQALSLDGYEIFVWILQAESFGIPQRRTRIFLLGLRSGLYSPTKPLPITGAARAQLSLGLPVCPSVKDALDDLPPLQPGQDGSHLDYAGEPSTPYQQFVRGKISAHGLLQQFPKP